MLNYQDRRIALFQVYKAARHTLTKQHAYAYAQVVVKPLPEDRETLQLRRAVARMADKDWRSCNTDQWCNTPRQLWAQAYQDARRGTL